ncbi:hypothetical protein BDW66DRAFT_144556 [Aspergillus desertorum]
MQQTRPYVGQYTSRFNYGCASMCTRRISKQPVISSLAIVAFIGNSMSRLAR